MNLLKLFSKRKAFTLSVTKPQKELLEVFLLNKPEFEDWLVTHPQSKTRFQFFYPNAIDFYYSDFKLFTAYFKKSKLDEIELEEMKMTEANFHSIRSTSWAPFEEVMIEFLTALEETKKIALFEKRKLLFEYESLCIKNTSTEENPKEFLSSITTLITR